MKLKKLASALVALAIAATMSVTVFAASDINANEQAILDALSAPVTTQGGTLNLRSDMIGQATNYMRRDDVNLSGSDKDAVVSRIDEARALLATTNATRWAEVPADVQQQVAVLAQGAAEALGLKLTYDLAGGTATIYDKDGSPVGSSAPAVGQMGFALNFGWAIAALVACAAVAGGILFSRKNRVAKAAC